MSDGSAGPSGPTHTGSGATETAALDLAAERLYRTLSFHTEDDRERAIQSLIQAVNTSSETARNAWLFFLAMMAYFFVAIAGVKDEALLLNTPVTLPVVNIAITMEAFFVFAPPVVLLIHFGLLLQHFLLADKTVKLNAILEREAEDGETLEDVGDIADVHRHSLHSYFFTQSIAGRQFGVFAKFLFYALSFVSFVFLPVMLLLSFQTKFLPYHQETITLSHRIYLIIDVLLVTFMLAKARAPRTKSLHGLLARASGRFVPFVVRNAFLLAALVYSFCVATVPARSYEKWVDATAGQVLPVAALREHLFDGEVDPIRGTTSSVFNRRMVVTDKSGLRQNLTDAQEKSKQAAPLGQRLNLRGRDLRGAVLDRTDLSGADLTNADLTDASLRGTNLSGAQLGGVRLTGAVLTDADMTGATFGCVESVIQVRKASGTETIRAQKCANLSNAKMDGSKLIDAHLVYARMEGADLTNAKLTNAKLEGINLRGADLSFAKMSGADMREADLSGATLIRAKLDAVNLEFADVQGANLLQADLSGAKLTLVRAPTASFRLANMHGADLQLAWLHVADLTGAALVAADLRGAQLIGAEVQLADLTGADLASAKLQGANLKHTSTQAANFSQAKVWETVPPSQNAKRRTVLSEIRFVQLAQRDQDVLAGIACALGIKVDTFGIANGQAVGVVAPTAFGTGSPAAEPTTEKLPGRTSTCAQSARPSRANDPGHEQRVRERLVRMLPSLSDQPGDGSQPEWRESFDYRIWSRLKAQSDAEFASIAKGASRGDRAIFESLMCGDNTPDARRSQVLLRRVLRANACPGRSSLMRQAMLAKTVRAETRFAHLFLRAKLFANKSEFMKQCPSFGTLDATDSQLISKIRGLMFQMSNRPQDCLISDAIDPPVAQ